MGLNAFEKAQCKARKVVSCPNRCLEVRDAHHQKNLLWPVARMSASMK